MSGGVRTMSAQEAQARQTHQRMRGEYEAIVNKIAELEGQRDEHILVLKTLEKLDPARRCFRSIGGVLVERTVGEVVPAVTLNKDNLITVIANLKEQLKERATTMNKFAIENNLVDPSQLQATAPKNDESEKKAQSGVLV